jgi:GDP-4-dehydro-6-deoxy-D-mannose reductase
MRAFITGISGFVGSHLARRLLEDGAEVVGYDLVRSAGAFRVETGDIRDGDRLVSLLRDVRPDVVYHLAAVASVREASHLPDEAFAINFQGTLQVLRAARESGADPEVMVVTSGEIYGKQEGSRKETDPLLPRNAYSLSKAAADLLALQQHFEHGIRAVRLRPFNHTGTGQALGFVSSDFARRIALAEAGIEPPSITVGNLDPVRDFLAVEDVVEAYRLAPGRVRAGGAYNIASGRGRTIREILDILLGEASRKIAVVPDPRWQRPGDVPHLVGDASKFREAAGWKPVHSLEEALRGLLDEWRGRVATQG